MTDGVWDFVGQDDQKFPFEKTVGDALCDLVRKRWNNNTAKQIERNWDLDPKTAKNVCQGHVSERTLTKAVRAEGWGLLEALGFELLGETYHQYEERKLRTIIEQAEQARENLTRLHTRRAALDERTRELDRTWDRKGA